MREQGEPASAITVEYRPHGQSRSDSPPGIATGFKCLTPIQREGWTPSGSPQVLISGQLYKKLPEDLRRQGEPASATRNTGHTDNPFEMDSPPGIAIQLRAPRAGYHMVRLGPRWTEDHINASSATETAYGALNGAGSYLERISGVIAWDWKDWHRRWRDSPKRHPPSWTG